MPDETLRTPEEVALELLVEWEGKPTPRMIAAALRAAKVSALESVARAGCFACFYDAFPAVDERGWRHLNKRLCDVPAVHDALSKLRGASSEGAAAGKETR